MDAVRRRKKNIIITHNRENQGKKIEIDNRTKHKKGQGPGYERERGKNDLVKGREG